MITTVSLSPAIDKRLEFDSFQPGETNRVAQMRMEGAGKAVNVAMGARALGLASQSIGLLAGGGEPLTERLRRLGVPYSFLPAPGTVRTNLKLYDRSADRTTEVNEPVPAATVALLQSAADAAIAAARESDWLVLTGSLPNQCPADWYARVLARVRQEAPDCRCVLDAEGERFSLATAQRPWLVKPNLYELELACKRKLTTQPQILDAARSLLRDGPQMAVISLGADGAIAVTSAHAWHAPALRVAIHTTTGAGDAMVAGLLHGFSQKLALPEALRHGIAAATSRCVQPDDAFLSRTLFEEYLPQVQIHTL